MYIHNSVVIDGGRRVGRWRAIEEDIEGVNNDGKK